MRITSLLAFILIVLGGLELLLRGLFAFSPSSLIFGNGTFLQRLFFCLVGASTIFFVAFVKVFKPFKSLCK